MTLSQSTLATALEGVVPEADAADAITNLVAAYEAYVSGNAVANAITISAAGVTAGKAAMAGALVGIEVPGAAAALVQASLVAFWAAAIVPGWPTQSGSAPQTFSTAAADIAATFLANTVGKEDLADSAIALAADIHDGTAGPPASGNGTVTFGGPAFPIL